jgi:hypothetical protein
MPRRKKTKRPRTLRQQRAAIKMPPTKAQIRKDNVRKAVGFLNRIGRNAAARHRW